MRKPRNDTSGYSLQELWSLNMPEQSFYADHLVPCEGLTILAGETGIGKSHLMLSIIFAIASGKPALGCLSTQRARIQVFTEDDEFILLPYTKRIGQNFGINGSAEVNFQIEVFRQWDFEQRVREYQPNVIFVDPISHISDLKNDNDNAQVYEYLYKLKAFCNEMNASLVFTRHLSKRDLKTTYSEENVFERILGAQAWKSVPYNRLLMWRDKQAGYMLSSYSKLGREFTWKLAFDKEAGNITLAEYAKETQRVSDYRLPIMQLLERFPDAAFKAEAILAHIQKEKSVERANSAALRAELNNMADKGLVVKLDNGYKYCSGLGELINTTVKYASVTEFAEEEE